MVLFAALTLVGLIEHGFPVWIAILVTLAVMVAGIGHIAGSGMRAPPGLHLLPRAAWEAHITLHPG